MIKKVWIGSILLIAAVWSLDAAASSGSNREKLNLRIEQLSKKLTKDYKLLVLRNDEVSMHSVKKDLDEIIANIHLLVESVGSKDANDIFAFLQYSRKEIDSMLQKKATAKRAILMEDYSKVFLEGAQQIAHQPENTKGAKHH